MIDFHCHLDLYANPLLTMHGSEETGTGVLSVTTTPSAWHGTSRLSRDSNMIRTAIGLHPQLARARKSELEIFDRCLEETRFVGEVGLDGSPEYLEFWNDQLHVFEHILASCGEAGGKILSVHSRRAVTPVLDYLGKHSASVPILHWFSGSKSELRRAIELGCWFSVGPGMLAGAKGRALVGAMPHERVLLETDGPFVHIKGNPAQPWDVRAVSARIADVWGIDAAEASQQVDANEKILLGG